VIEAAVALVPRLTAVSVTGKVPPKDAVAGRSLGARMARSAVVVWTTALRQLDLRVCHECHVLRHRIGQHECVPCTTMHSMAQLTVRLPDDLNRALKAASRRMQRRSSEIVRMALQDFLGMSRESRGRPADRVRGLIGSLESGVPDLARRHRAYLLESLKHGR